MFPGLTEESAARWLAEASGLRPGRDFQLGYSPERINPGDREHRLETITKVVAADDASERSRGSRRSTARSSPAGLHRAPSIRVAEAAKVIENTQRDLNIALMNELALICDRLGIRTADVLRGSGDQVELPAVHAGPGRRPLHRRRPLLPDRQGRAAGLPPAR